MKRKYEEINLAAVMLLETQSMGIHDELQGLQSIIECLYTDNISQIYTEVVAVERCVYNSRTIRRSNLIALKAKKNCF